MYKIFCIFISLTCTIPLPLYVSQSWLSIKTPDHMVTSESFRQYAMMRIEIMMESASAIILEQTIHLNTQSTAQQIKNKLHQIDKQLTLDILLTLYNSVLKENANHANPFILFTRIHILLSSLIYTVHKKTITYIRLIITNSNSLRYFCNASHVAISSKIWEIKYPAPLFNKQ